MADEPPSISDWLALYSDQTPRQATLLIPRWAQERLEALNEELRRSILAEVDQVASEHGLLTPTIIEVIDE